MTICRLVGANPLSEHMLDSKVRNKFQWNLKQNLYIFIQENTFENVVCEMAAILPRLQCVKQYLESCEANQRFILFPVRIASAACRTLMPLKWVLDVLLSCDNSLMKYVCCMKRMLGH